MKMNKIMLLAAVLIVGGLILGANFVVGQCDPATDQCGSYLESMLKTIEAKVYDIDNKISVGQESPYVAVVEDAAFDKIKRGREFDIRFNFGENLTEEGKEWALLSDGGATSCAMYELEDNGQLGLCCLYPKITINADKYNLILTK